MGISKRQEVLRVAIYLVTWWVLDFHIPNSCTYAWQPWHERQCNNQLHDMMALLASSCLALSPSLSISFTVIASTWSDDHTHICQVPLATAQHLIQKCVEQGSIFAIYTTRLLRVWNCTAHMIIERLWSCTNHSHCPPSPIREIYPFPIWKW